MALAGYRGEIGCPVRRRIDWFDFEAHSHRNSRAIEPIDGASERIDIVRLSHESVDALTDRVRQVPGRGRDDRDTELEAGPDGL